MVSTVREISFTLFFVSIVTIAVLRLISRSTPLKSGRSPPNPLSPSLGII